MLITMKRKIDWDEQEHSRDDEYSSDEESDDEEPRINTHVQYCPLNTSRKTMLTSRTSRLAVSTRQPELSS